MGVGARDRRLATLATVALALLAGALAISAAACGSEDGRKAVDLNLSPIQTLADAANRDAGTMTKHADAMVSIAQARPDHAHWASDADIARANAASLRLIAGSAIAIVGDQQAFPATGDSLDLRRLLGDGPNLMALGKTLGDHAEAMSQHLEVMRDQANGDATLLPAIDDLAGDVRSMTSDARAAIDAGQRLADVARNVARGIGATIE